MAVQSVKLSSSFSGWSCYAQNWGGDSMCYGRMTWTRNWNCRSKRGNGISDYESERGDADLTKWSRPTVTLTWVTGSTTRIKSPAEISLNQNPTKSRITNKSATNPKNLQRMTMSRSPRRLSIRTVIAKSTPQTLGRVSGSIHLRLMSFHPSLSAP